MLVGGSPEAILAASVVLHDVAFRTDDVGKALAVALGPAATTLVATIPFAPVQAAAARLALEAVLIAPGAGLGNVAAAYEGASFLLRAAGQALEVAGLATMLSAGGLARLRGERATVLGRIPEGEDVNREAMSLGMSALAAGRTSTVAVREVRQGGATFYVVELTATPKIAASLGIQANGFGGYAEAAAGAETTLRWAVATREDAELLVAQASVGLLPGGEVLAGLPTPSEVTLAGVGSAMVVGTVLPFLTSGSGTLTTRYELTSRAGGGERLAATISGAGAARPSGTTGAASVRIGIERHGGQVTKLTLGTATEVDRGAHGMKPVEALNREATLEEREWELELTPDLRARADRVAAALADRRAPDPGDVRALAEAVDGVEPTVRTYDVRHQQASLDFGIPGANGGGSLAMDTARLRTPDRDEP